MGIVPIFEFQNLKKSGHSDFQEKRQFGTGLFKIGLDSSTSYCFVQHVVLETIKQHLRILMVKQYSKAIFLRINAKTLEHPGPCSVLGGRALTQDWGERWGGVGGGGPYF